MLCLKAEAVGREIYSASHGVILPVNLGGSLQKAMHKGGSRKGSSSSHSSKSGDGYVCSSGFEGIKSIGSRKGTDQREKVGCYRFQLEREVQILQKQLQEEINLHMALANAVAHNNEPLLSSPFNIPDEAQELLANIAELEITVLKLEEELATLHFQLSNERNERHLAETHLKCLPLSSLELRSVSGFMWEEHISSLRASKTGESQIPHSWKLDFSSGKICSRGKLPRSCKDSKEKPEIVSSFEQDDAMYRRKNPTLKDIWNHPNRLSEEMVRCMRDIFLCLSESSSASSKVSSSKLLPSSSSPVGHLSQSSLASSSDSSMRCQELDIENSFDPYGVNGKVNWQNIGSYGLADEVSWLSVGKDQLEYAAEALKKFRFLVEELGKVDPSHMSNDEKLAFWINVYNALIMHAYLAYGVPRSDIKLFCLMQKVSYTVAGQSFSAVDIEFIILKMKPPAHRPQIALVLAVHSFKISEEHRLYSIDAPEPLLVFALSSGMYSSPAVRIFTADNIHDELQKSMRDYIQASIGISDKGKLLVPKLLHSFARGIVEDSLLVDWICRYLTPDQVTVVRDSTSQKKQRLLGVRSFSIIPFDSRFRYLFLPDNRITQNL
ncbi:uncharacterized protein A4U43_C08F26300 [Asparagus officinalis]|uniref:uncharacterized protein LOC109819754 n=1 Tax=Asparagus officinalis TaxID=4686 RepID=UPI00098E2A19|nr:uncharacterized protein LOC109819754 [Asparagus officinalis]ONK61105.1 uncharacterized protein A4U43_C08F26300 [Asparagus officinalis]